MGGDNDTKVNGVKYEFEGGRWVVKKIGKKAPGVLTILKQVEHHGEKGDVVLIDCKVKGWKGSKIIIGANVQNIKEDSFNGLDDLREVVFESGSKLEILGEDAFKKTGIRSVAIPAKLKIVGKEAFAECEALAGLTFAAGCVLDTIGEQAFEKSAIRDIHFPASLKLIKKEAFQKCKNLSTLWFESSVTIEPQAFEDCPLKLVKYKKEFTVRYAWPSGCKVEVIEPPKPKPAPAPAPAKKKKDKSSSSSSKKKKDKKKDDNVVGEVAEGLSECCRLV
jgi:hypothetical protein